MLSEPSLTRFASFFPRLSILAEEPEPQLYPYALTTVNNQLQSNSSNREHTQAHQFNQTLSMFYGDLVNKSVLFRLDDAQKVGLQKKSKFFFLLRDKLSLNNLYVRSMLSLRYQLPLVLPTAKPDLRLTNVSYQLADIDSVLVS